MRSTQDTVPVCQLFTTSGVRSTQVAEPRQSLQTEYSEIVIITCSLARNLVDRALFSYTSRR